MTTARLPLFPLNSVLFPGLVLPLNVFEQRYRALMRDLSQLPESEPRRFGVVAIRDGHEVAPSSPGLPEDARPEPGPASGFGADPLRAFHSVGCVADAAAIRPQQNGTYEVLATGTTRFRLLSVDASGPYLVGEVEEIPEQQGEGAGALASGVVRAFRAYQKRLAGGGRAVAGGPGGPAGRSVGALLSRRRGRRPGHPRQAAAAPGPGHRLPADGGAAAAARGDGRDEQVAVAARGGHHPAADEPQLSEGTW
ncbi:hypothetical protein GCM10020000_60190 [Streptomyces olivoverticillatus]